MADVTYENIQSLIESSKQEGSALRCVFKCPVSGSIVESQAAIQPGRGLGDLAKKSAKRSLFSQVRWGISRAIRSALGYGLGGRVAGDVAGAAVGSAMEKRGTTFSEDEKKAAVVQAFENVISQFVWDGKNSRWIAAAAASDILTDFTSQLNKAPLTQNYDRGVLARMLVEIAMADGQLTEEEKSFLSQFTAPEMDGVDALANRPPLSTAELAECSKGDVRETMLMIAWGLACTDKDLAEAETRRLSELAQGLGIADTRVAELQGYAQKFVIDQAMDSVYPDGKLDSSAKNEVFQFADKIGLDRGEAERVEIRYRKRNGLV